MTPPDPLIIACAGLAGTGKDTAAARELGISRGMANRIRAGKAWAPLCATASVWSWRP